MPNPAVSYGYVRAEAVAGQPGALILSGLILNGSVPSGEFILTVAFNGAGSFQTPAFSLPEGAAAAFSYLIEVPFAGAHAGTLELTGSGPVTSNSTSFKSDPSTQDLGFQIFIVGHPMPDVDYPAIPSTTFAIEELS